MKPLDDYHRQNHQAVLVGFESAKESVCHIPNESGFLLDVFPGPRNQGIAGGHGDLPLYFSAALETQRA